MIPNQSQTLGNGKDVLLASRGFRLSGKEDPQGFFCKHLEWATFKEAPFV